MHKRQATFILLILLSLLSIFHLLIVLQIIPYDQVWGGRLTSVEEMYQFEIIGLLVTLFMLSIVYLHYRNLKQGKSNKLIRIFLWIFFAYFLLNTLGNLLAESIWEMILGTAITLSAAGLCWGSLKGR